MALMNTLSKSIYYGEKTKTLDRKTVYSLIETMWTVLPSAEPRFQQEKGKIAEYFK